MKSEGQHVHKDAEFEDDGWYTEERVNPDDILIPARERNELRRGMKQIRDFAAHDGLLAR